MEEKAENDYPYTEGGADVGTEERFNAIVELFRHMCDELVDDPESLIVSAVYTGVTGCIEVVGPQQEVSKIFGARKNTIMAIEKIGRAHV